MSPVRKTYVLDTNVLIHDPDSLFKFDEHTVAIPVEVLSELDRLKTQPGQLGASARKVNRSVRGLFENRPLKEVVEGDPARPMGKHHDSASEEHRLVGAVGDEHGGAAGLRADRTHVFL